MFCVHHDPKAHTAKGGRGFLENYQQILKVENEDLKLIFITRSAGKIGTARPNIF